MITFTAELLFWLSTVALFYTYLGYPLLLVFVSTLRPRLVTKGDFNPIVSVIITAHNEAQDLAEKLENTLSLDYPKDLLEVIVASDCSTDETDEIARSFSARGVKLHRQSHRMGKTAAQNAAVELARGEIILFSDATTMYREDVLKVLLRSFADRSVGCVAGRLLYVDPSQSNVGRGTTSYWGYETFLKQNESRACSLIGASGCLYAVRRSAYVPLYHEACSDFIIATKMVEQGLRAVFEPDAICTESTNRESNRELAMRVRVITQTLADLWRHRSVMNPFRYGFYAVQLFSHKVMRYLVPFFLILVLISSAVLAAGSKFFLVLFVCQVMVYLAAAASWVLERAGIRSELLAFPQYFAITIIATMVAFYKFIGGERYASWQPIREQRAVAPTPSAAPARPAGKK